MTLRKPLTLMHDETLVPFSILEGTRPRQPANIVIQSPNRFKSAASFHADAGERSDDVETSTRDTGSTYPAGREINPRVLRLDSGPGLIELLCYVDDLRLLRSR